MSNHQLLTEKCVPVQQEGAHYVVAEEWLRCDLPLPDRNELKSVVSAPYKRIRGFVQVGDALVRAAVYVPDSQDEYSFALLEQSPDHVIKRDETEKLDQVLEPYLEAFESNYAFSEAILPEQRCYLYSTFTEPTLYNSHINRTVTCSRTTNISHPLITGMAGAGKTTLCRHWALELAREYHRSSEPIIPVYITLRNWALDSRCETHIRRELSALKGDWIAKNFDGLARDGAIAIVFDGVDEIADEFRPQAVDEIGQFINQYSKCRFVVASRFGAVPRLPTGFTNVELQPFTDSQVRELIYHKLFGERAWKPFWGRLAAEPALMKLAGNPLLLTILLARYLRKEFTPHFITESLGAMVEALIDHWDAIRGVVRSKNAELSPARKAGLLKNIAGYIMERQQNTFTTLEVTDKIRRVYPDGAPSETLELLERHTSLIGRNKEGAWSFRHRLMQEFFACTHWADRLDATMDKYVAELVSHANPDTSLMLRLMTGLASDASGAIKRALNSAPPYKVDTAIGLCETMTQRLSVEPAVVEGFAAYCRILFEDLLTKSEDTRFVTEPGGDIIWSMRAIGKTRDVEWAKSFGALLTAVHKTRDGSASRILFTVFQNSDLPALVNISKLLHAEGELKTGYDRHENKLLVSAEVRSEFPEIPETPN